MRPSWSVSTSFWEVTAWMGAHTARNRTGTLPKAQIFPFSALADGKQDSQWVKVRGIVRWASIDSTSWQETTLAMRVASGGGEFNLRAHRARTTGER